LASPRKRLALSKREQGELLFKFYKAWKKQRRNSKRLAYLHATRRFKESFIFPEFDGYSAEEIADIFKSVR